ncbi:RNA interference and silencing protein [Pochonia chlamydosporia 170]|uniref:RNA interference and silencing protein n=1 Tax=Pochonia chlamydosporia 170 TaxID=1380566 RepID=A0A179FFU9_METCM|nr:RNA interference and silencing protein [Pochonia chlamydosporia 170]OAQ64402.2 RNA interference and silencing protein [Pochonia chlamydosporia 170]
MSSHQTGRGRGRYTDRGGGGGRGRGRGWEASLQVHDTSRAPRGRGRGRGGSWELQIYSQGDQTAQVDTNVAQKETNYETAAKTVNKKKLAALGARYPPRPGFGTQGRAVVLWTNHLHLAFDGNLQLFRYSIRILPEQGDRPPVGKKAKRVIQLLLEEHFPQYGQSIATDFKAILISKQNIEVAEEYNVLYRSEDEEEPAPNAKRYRVQLDSTGSVTVSELTDYLTSSNFGALLSSKEETLQALNIVLGHHSKDVPHIASVGANRHFDLTSPDKQNLGAGLLAIRGFFVSVRAATARLLVNVQVKHGAFYVDYPLDRLMTEYMAVNGPNTARLANFVKRVSVNVTHIVRRNRAGEPIKRIKVIRDFARVDDGRNQEHPPIVPHFGAGPRDVKFFVTDTAGSTAGPSRTVPGAGPSTTGKSKKKKAAKGPTGPAVPTASQGRYVSVYDHFKNTYHITIRDPTLPVINVGSREMPSYLPPEVCVVLPGQPANKQLTPSQLQQMIKFAVRRPAQNAQSITASGVRTLGVDPINSTLAAFGIHVSRNLLAVPGRVLNCPAVKYKGDKTVASRLGSWNMQFVQFAVPKQLSRWTWLWISLQGMRDPWRNIMELKSSLGAFRNVLQRLGLVTAECLDGIHITVNQDNADSEIDTAIQRFAKGKSIPPQLLLVILPSDIAAIYKRVKADCDVRGGLLNVCVVAKKFFNANEQYYANVAMKVNLKLGGQNHYVDKSKLGILSEGKTMVVGIDVTHPSPGSSSQAPSVASIAASIDGNLAQWPADLRIQTARQEMVAGLDAMFQGRLRLWRKHNGRYPDNILVCRDGVSEGQYDQVLDQELPAMRSACKEIYPADATKQGLPHFTIVIVGKRHNTRFYPTRTEDADRSANPQNGTVVDRGVTEAQNWDFFLQAHAAIQGTARPAHYYTILDEIFAARPVKLPLRNSADVLEDLMHNMCYLFGRATKAVSICPPAYYADLVCDRARCYLSDLFSPTASTSPGASVAGDTAVGDGADRRLVEIHGNVRDRWICALPIELAAGQEMLDEEDDDPLEYDAESDLYTFGRIGEHNVILACLPAGQTGTNSAAAVATRIASTFTSLRFSLMVGIGGGVPSVISDVRLGDVVISQPFMQHGGVVQYDFGKIGTNGHSMRTGALNAPPAILLKAVSKLRALHYRGRSNLAAYLSTFDRLEAFSRDAAGADILYEAAYNHVGGPTCQQCSQEKEVKRLQRMQGPVIHCGTIASGNRVIQDGITRDRISEELGGVLCYEMESAGLMNAFPCLVIRGICDYADSHKHKKWQPYAAATAAACAKEILSLVPAKASTTNTGPSSEEYARQLCQIKFPSEEVVKLQQGIKTLQEQSKSLHQQYDTSMTVGQQHLQAQYALLQQLRSNLVDLKHQALERELPPEIKSNAYVTVFDAENRPLRFVFDTMSSQKIMSAMKRQLKDVELDNMRRGEWYIRDRRERASESTELSSSLLRACQCLNISVKFRLPNKSSTLCPVCHLENPGDSDQQ